MNLHQNAIKFPILFFRIGNRKDEYQQEYVEKCYSLCCPCSKLKMIKCLFPFFSKCLVIFFTSKCKFRSEYEEVEKCRCLCCPCSKFQITFSTLKANFLQELHLGWTRLQISILDHFKEATSLPFVDGIFHPANSFGIFIQPTRSVKTRKELSEKLSFF